MTAPLPPADNLPPDFRPLKKGTGRLLILVAMLLSLGGAFLAAYVVLRNDQDPQLQQRLEQLRQLQAADSSGTAPDSMQVVVDTLQ